MNNIFNRQRTPQGESPAENKPLDMGDPAAQLRFVSLEEVVATLRGDLRKCRRAPKDKQMDAPRTALRSGLPQLYTRDILQRNTLERGQTHVGGPAHDHRRTSLTLGAFPPLRPHGRNIGRSNEDNGGRK